MIDITDRKLVLETAIKRFRQSGKTGLAAGLEEVLRERELAGAETHPVVAAAVAETLKGQPLEDVPEYVAQNGEIELIKKSINAGIHCCLTGPASCGKTHLYLWVAKELGREIYTIQGGAGSTYERIVQADTLVAAGNSTVTGVRDSLLPLAMKRGAILYIDEPNAVEPDVLFYCHSAMDDRATISFPDGQTLKASDGFVVVAAMNEGYRGTTKLNEAFRSRTATIWNMDYLPPLREAKVLTSRVQGLEPEMARKLTECAATLRAAVKARQLRTDIGTRALLAAAKLIVLGVDPVVAATATITNQAEERSTDHKSIADIVAATFGKGVA
jgi:nitric oxide reductase NorQ protein